MTAALCFSEMPMSYQMITGILLLFLGGVALGIHLCKTMHVAL